MDHTGFPYQSKLTRRTPFSIVQSVPAVVKFAIRFNLVQALLYLAGRPLHAPKSKSTSKVTKSAKLTASHLSARSLAAIRPHISAAWVAPLAKILRRVPVLVRIAGRRKSKHGDHRLAAGKGYSIISVNNSGNPWQFVLTLLHELAHAEVAHECGAKAAPHGREWKTAFRRLLTGHLDLFPADLQPAVADYARHPLYSTSSHPQLAAALRCHDTTDHRPTVAELEDGEQFTLDGRLVLTRQRLLRKRYLCTAADGKEYHVSPAARVHGADHQADGMGRDLLL